MAEKKKVKIIKPQPGPQEEFLSSPADIVIYGGSVFSGKTYALLLDPLRYIESVKGFGAVVFRRNLTQVTNEGGLWDEAKKLYVPLGAVPIENPYRFRFRKFGNKIEYHHLSTEHDVSSWDGAQIPAVYFDELQHFTANQFWYLLSRNRSGCGVKPYCRATCNPPENPNSWLTKLLDWWIDKDGWPIKERSGVIRYFIRRDNVVYWADSEKELKKKFHGEKIYPKSFTFIPAQMSDNKIGMEKDPQYEANVEAQVTSQRLRMRGNWKVKSEPGELFRSDDFEIVEKDELPQMKMIVRYWDRAGTKPSEDNPDPDYTSGVKMGIGYDDYIYILDVQRFRFEPPRVHSKIKIRAKIERRDTLCVLEQDPGQAGKAEAAYYDEDFGNIPVDFVLKTSKMSKIAMWRPLSLQVRKKRVKLLEGSWNEAFISEAEQVIDGTQSNIHDDQIDAAAGAFFYLMGGKKKGTQGGYDAI